MSTIFLVKCKNKPEFYGGFELIFETANRSRAFEEAWRMKRDENIESVYIEEITTYCFKEA